MSELFNIEDYKRVSNPQITPLEARYFCIGYYIGRGWFQGNWKLFPELWLSLDHPSLQDFIKEKEKAGYIIFVCKLPELK